MAARLAIGGQSHGTERSVAVFRYGRAGARPKAYIQAGLHADEIPGMLVCHHLRRLLAGLEAEGRIRGEVVVVPVANPIGLDQVVAERPVGRFALAGGGNFNRLYPDLAPIAADLVEGRLGSDPAANVATIRAALLQALDGLAPLGPVDRLRHALLGLAIDADIVLDLHCDEQALPHLYLGTPLWPEGEDLARWIGSEVTLIAEASGGHPFDEACSAPWWTIPRRLDDGTPVPPACCAATVELRGAADVSESFAALDARALLGFLAGRGLIEGAFGQPPPLRAPATPLEGVDMVTAPVAGVVTFRVEPGDLVAKGDIVAEIVDPLAEVASAGRTPLLAATEGRVFARTAARYARPGDVVAKIAGARPLPGKGGQLLTSR